MTLIYLLLLIGALLCFVLAAFGIAARVNLIAAGLALWVMVPLLAYMQAVAR